MAQLIKLQDYVSRYEEDLSEYSSKFVRLKKRRWQAIVNTLEQRGSRLKNIEIAKRKTALKQSFWISYFYHKFNGPARPFRRDRLSSPATTRIHVCAASYNGFPTLFCHVPACHALRKNGSGIGSVAPDSFDDFLHCFFKRCRGGGIYWVFFAFLEKCCQRG